MVNGENPHIGFDFYLETIRSLHEALPDVHLKCYTASEIHHMTTLSGLTHEEVLRELQAAGLGSLPGGGAEVFADRVRRLVAPGKEHPDIWFHVHDTAHRLGIPTHCTMLYGHVETYEERVDHIIRLRDQQDRTGGFLAFIPLAFHPENTVFERRGFRHTTGADDLKMLAFSRLMLDNVPNIKAYWIMMGMPMAAVALHFGANDVQGTVVREEIFQAAGASAGTEQKVSELVRFVRRQAASPSSATPSTTRSGAGDSPDRSLSPVRRPDHPGARHRGVGRLVPRRARLRRVPCRAGVRDRRTRRVVDSLLGAERHRARRSPTR